MPILCCNLSIFVASHTLKTHAFILSLLAICPHFSSAKASEAQSPDNINELIGMSFEELLDVEVNIGTRIEGRTRVDTLAPVDLISTEDLRVTGQAELGKALQEIAPSFNFNNTTISDGTDIIRPATLRGLGPDQTLVLINGKRRHQQALVHVQETVGKGSAGYDINTIPIAAIERVEILRDGAAAQYGSDAIAGVINIVLKKQTDAVLLQAESGQTYEGDGDNLALNMNTGFGDENLWLNLTLDLRNRDAVNRAGLAELTSTGGNFIGNWRGENGEPVQRLQIGEAQSDNYSFWFNGGAQVTDELELYAFGGVSRREGQSFGFFRGPGSERMVPQIYPLGFLPQLLTTVDDDSFTTGLRGSLNQEWEFDLSYSWGHSSFNFASENSANISWYYEPDGQGGIIGETPTSANAGTLKYRHTMLNADLRGTIETSILPNPLSVALGAEFRNEGYQIIQGDPWSYRYGRNDDPTLNIVNTDNHGAAPPGMQGFPGFRPVTEVDEDRENKALYMDFETQLSEKTSVAAAIRWENYQFAGSNITGKLSFRQQVHENLALRSTLSTGFRAPGVQQIYYAQVQTTLVEGDLRETGTFNNTSDVANDFGIASLEEETSQQFSVGLVTQNIDNLFFTVDLFHINIDDRIVLSDPITGFSPVVQSILDANRLGAAQFFTNAMDTQTSGIDIVGAYSIDIDSALLKLQAALSFVDTEVKDLNSSSDIVDSSQLINQVQIQRIEEGQPGERFTVSASYIQDSWKGNLAFHYFGDVSGSGFTDVSHTWSGKWITDLSFDYILNGDITLSIGGNNIFDVMPDEWGPAGQPLSEAGFVYGWETLPFGISGGYYYARVKAAF